MVSSAPDNQPLKKPSEKTPDQEKPDRAVSEKNLKTLNFRFPTLA
jgi:hypothetical protein